MSTAKIDSVRALIDMDLLGSAEHQGLGRDAEIAEALGAHGNNVCAAAAALEEQLRRQLSAKGAALGRAVAPLPRSALEATGSQLGVAPLSGGSLGSPGGPVADGRDKVADRMFAALDADGDGVITRDELLQGLAMGEPVGAGHPLPLSLQPAALATTRRDSADEFLRSPQLSYIPPLSAEHSGTLSPQSFQSRFSSRDASLASHSSHVHILPRWTKNVDTGDTIAHTLERRVGSPGLRDEVPQQTALIRRVRALLNSGVLARAEDAGAVNDAGILNALQDSGSNVSLAAARYERALRAELGGGTESPAATPLVTSSRERGSPRTTGWSAAVPAPALAPAPPAVDIVAERMFDMLDVDGDGVITREELKSSMGLSPVQPSRAATVALEPEPTANAKTWTPPPADSVAERMFDILGDSSTGAQAIREAKAQSPRPPVGHDAQLAALTEMRTEAEALLSPRAAAAAPAPARAYIRNIPGHPEWSSPSASPGLPAPAPESPAPQRQPQPEPEPEPEPLASSSASAAWDALAISGAEMRFSGPLSGAERAAVQRMSQLIPSPSDGFAAIWSSEADGDAMLAVLRSCQMDIHRAAAQYAAKLQNSPAAQESVLRQSQLSSGPVDLNYAAKLYVTELSSPVTSRLAQKDAEMDLILPAAAADRPQTMKAAATAGGAGILYQDPELYFQTINIEPHADTDYAVQKAALGVAINFSQLTARGTALGDAVAAMLDHAEAEESGELTSWELERATAQQGGRQLAPDLEPELQVEVAMEREVEDNPLLEQARRELEEMEVEGPPGGGSGGGGRVAAPRPDGSELQRRLWQPSQVTSELKAKRDYLLQQVAAADAEVSNLEAELEEKAVGRSIRSTGSRWVQSPSLVLETCTARAAPTAALQTVGGSWDVRQVESSSEYSYAPSGASGTVDSRRHASPPPRATPGGAGGGGATAYRQMIYSGPSGGAGGGDPANRSLGNELQKMLIATEMSLLKPEFSLTVSQADRAMLPGAETLSPQRTHSAIPQAFRSGGSAAFSPGGTRRPPPGQHLRHAPARTTSSQIHANLEAARQLISGEIPLRPEPEPVSAPALKPWRLSDRQIDGQIHALLYQHDPDNQHQPQPQPQPEPEPENDAMLWLSPSSRTTSSRSRVSASPPVSTLASAPYSGAPSLSPGSAGFAYARRGEPGEWDVVAAGGASPTGSGELSEAEAAAIARGRREV